MDRSLFVLLVEDSKLLAERLSEMITSIAGFELAAVVDTESAALDMLLEQRVDVVVLDLHLRQGTGFGVLRAINKQPTRPVVVVLTNYDLVEYRRTATMLGAQHFLDKVLEMHQLPEVLDQIRARLANGT